ncbi:MAG: response regulator transcription factor [bacterium]|nr:response regulator transcription factor [bacterium]
MRILLIEDNKALVKSLKKGLEEETFAVDVAYDGEEGLFLAENNPYDIIILDLMLPKLDGITLLQRLRRQKIQTHILVLTARDAPDEKVRGLDAGADDYLTKPFHYDELLARLRALLRREYQKKEPILTIGDLKLNTRSHQVWRNTKEIILQPKEYAVLEYLAYHQNEIVSRTQLWEHLYDWQDESTSNIIDVYINHLRNKIDKDFPNKMIITIRGEGYMLKGE